MRSVPSSATARRVARLIRNCEPKVPVDEGLRYAWTARQGVVDPTWKTLATLPALAVRRHRIVAVSDRHVYMFSASLLSNFRPKRLLHVLDATVLLVAFRRNGLVIAGEYLRVNQSYAGQVIGAVSDVRR